MTADVQALVNMWWGPRCGMVRVGIDGVCVQGRGEGEGREVYRQIQLCVYLRILAYVCWITTFLSTIHRNIAKVLMSEECRGGRGAADNSRMEYIPGMCWKPQEISTNSDGLRRMFFHLAVHVEWPALRWGVWEICFDLSTENEGITNCHRGE